MLICPKCALPLSEGERSAACRAGHSFDRARQGYWNLLMDSAQRGHGDDAAMLRARRVFLERGHYEPLASLLSQTVASLLPHGESLLDSGCGEGYYTQRVMSHLWESGKGAELFAFDIAKDAVKMTASRMGGKGHFFVASTFHIPIETESIAVAMSLFSPYSEAEFLRVLRPGGYLIRAVALEKHLFSLKEAVYESPTLNQGKAKVGEGFAILSEQRLTYPLLLKSQEEIRSLFDMTPYAHKTSPEDRKKLEKLEKLETEADFGLIVMQKRS